MEPPKYLDTTWHIPPSFSFSCFNLLEMHPLLVHLVSEVISLDHNWATSRESDKHDIIYQTENLIPLDWYHYEKHSAEILQPRSFFLAEICHILFRVKHTVHHQIDKPHFGQLKSKMMWMSSVSFSRDAAQLWALSFSFCSYPLAFFFLSSHHLIANGKNSPGDLLGQESW